MSNDHLLAYFGVKNVATLLARRQLRFLGHLARMPEQRVQRQLLRSWRLKPGCGAAGCRGPSLLGVFGQAGTYAGRVRTHLTGRIKVKYFEAKSTTSWIALAQRKAGWRKFISTVYVK